MKFNSRLTNLALAAALSACLLQGCYGSFNLTRKLYTWNGSLGDRFVKSLVMWVMLIIPVYGLAGLADLAILNLVEFWTGSNPMAMKAGEREIRFVERDGQKYILTATPNRLDVARANGDHAMASLIYDPATKSWYAESAAHRVRIAEVVDAEKQILDLIHPDGSRERVAAGG
jgi:hypothetical protein